METIKRLEAENKEMRRRVEALEANYLRLDDLIVQTEDKISALVNTAAEAKKRLDACTAQCQNMERVKDLAIDNRTFIDDIGRVLERVKEQVYQESNARMLEDPIILEKIRKATQYPKEGQ